MTSFVVKYGQTWSEKDGQKRWSKEHGQKVSFFHCHHHESRGHWDEQNAHLFAPP
jgi:hypothetical protein